MAGMPHQHQAGGLGGPAQSMAVKDGGAVCRLPVVIWLSPLIKNLCSLAQECPIV